MTGYIGEAHLFFSFVLSQLNTECHADTPRLPPVFGFLSGHNVAINSTYTWSAGSGFSIPFRLKTINRVYSSLLSKFRTDVLVNIAIYQ